MIIVVYYQASSTFHLSHKEIYLNYPHLVTEEVVLHRTQLVSEMNGISDANIYALYYVQIRGKYEIFEPYLSFKSVINNKTSYKPP